MKNKIAIIGGSGLSQWADLHNSEPIQIVTPYGMPSSGAVKGYIQGAECVFIPRHGEAHEIPPHKVNYRANIYSLSLLGVKSIIAINMVGGISEKMAPLSWVVPDQIIDYTYGREQTFYDGEALDRQLVERSTVEHIDLTYPYSLDLRERLIATLNSRQVHFIEGGVYGCTQGPRLETAAEIARLAKDNCDVVGMTAMPEAALARELGIEYASICIVVNWAAGIAEELITIEAIIANCKESISLLQKYLPDLCIELAT